MTWRNRAPDRGILPAVLLTLLVLLLAGGASAAQPDYRGAMARGAFLEALPAADAALAGAAPGSPQWFETALDVARRRIETGRYAQAAETIGDIAEALKAHPSPEMAATASFL